MRDQSSHSASAQRRRPSRVPIILDKGRVLGAAWNAVWGWSLTTAGSRDTSLTNDMSNGLIFVTKCWLIIAYSHTTYEVKVTTHMQSAALYTACQKVRNRNLFYRGEEACSYRDLHPRTCMYSVQTYMCMYTYSINNNSVLSVSQHQFTQICAIDAACAWCIQVCQVCTFVDVNQISMDIYGFHGILMDGHRYIQMSRRNILRFSREAARPVTCDSNRL